MRLSRSVPPKRPSALVAPRFTSAWLRAAPADALSAIFTIGFRAAGHRPEGRLARSRIGRPLQAGAGRPPSHLQRSDVLTASFAAQLRDSRLLVVRDLHASPWVAPRVHYQLLVVVRTARRLAPPWRQIVPVKQQRRHCLPPFESV